MPSHFADGDLRRFFRRVAVHPRADGREADGADGALVGQFQALAVAPGQQLRFAVAAIAIHRTHRVEYVLRRQVARARRHRAAGGASALPGADGGELAPDGGAAGGAGGVVARAGGGGGGGGGRGGGGPRGGWGAPPTPPPPANAELAALAM